MVLRVKNIIVLSVISLYSLREWSSTTGQLEYVHVFCSYKLQVLSACVIAWFQLVLLQEKSRLKEIQHGQNVQSHPRRVLDERVKEIKDQLIRAKAYLNFVPAGGNSNFMKEIKLRIKELERAAGDVSKDSDLSRR